MPKKRKGSLPESARHIRRLVKEEVINEVRNVISESCSSTTTPIQSEIPVQIFSKLQPQMADTMVEIPELPETDRIEMEMPTLFNMNIENEDDSSQFNESEDLTDADTQSDASSVFRYSDSDAESLPDIADDHAFSFDVLQNSPLEEENKFQNDITEWAILYKTPHNSLKALLAILNENTNSRFPADPRTLLKTQK